MASELTRTLTRPLMRTLARTLAQALAQALERTPYADHLREPASPPRGACFVAHNMCGREGCGCTDG
eukprot:1390262-Alexandrium_andersonii.AAC.1